MIRKTVKRIEKREQEGALTYWITYVRVRWTFLGIPFYTKQDEIGRRRALFQ